MVWLAGALRYSAYPPSTVTPVICWRRQSVSRPARQYSHAPQVEWSQGTPTRSPGASGGSPSSPGPHATTVPVTSCPGMRGRRVIGLSISHSPLIRWRSEWQTPQAATRTSTSPGPGSGSGTSRIVSGSPKAGSTAARIVVIVLPFPDGTPRQSRRPSRRQSALGSNPLQGAAPAYGPQGVAAADRSVPASARAG